MDHRLLRAGLLLLVEILALAEGQSLLAQQLPFQVYAAEHGIVVRGGPGEAYYATQDLKHGEELTVYRIEDEDWYAIRPPRGSFSLVSATAVADHGDGTGEVVRSGAASRLGSSITELQDTVHVRLEKGERIQILGARMRDGVKWLRIEPPHGEFRWVHRGDVTASPPDEAPAAEVAEARASDVLALAQGTDRYGAPLMAADTPRPLPPPNAKTQADGSVETIAPEPLKPNSKPAAEPNPTAGDAFARQMFVMEVELGRMVADPPTMWNLGGLEQDAAKLLSGAKTEQERDSVRQFAARLERFSSIRRRHELVSPVDGLLAARMPTAGVSAMPQVTAVPNTVAQSISDAGGATQQVDPRFDAMGLLRPVASKRADAPKFALVNDAGQIITFVTPAPDVNLQPYLGRRIGVSGTRGYMAEFNHRHVTAGRVMPVGDRLLR